MPYGIHGYQKTKGRSYKMVAMVYFGSMKIGMPNGPGVNEQDFITDILENDYFESVAVYSPMTATFEKAFSVRALIMPLCSLPVLRELHGAYLLFRDIYTKRVKCDVMVFRLGQLPFVQLLLILLLNRLNILTHIKTVGVGSARSPSRKSPISYLNFLLRKWIFNFCDSIDAPTPIARDAIAKRFGIPDDKVILVENGARRLPLAESKVRATKSFTLGYVGRFPLVRGGRQLVQVLKAGTEAGLDLRGVITGDDEETSELKALATSLGIRDRIEFTGLLAKDKIPELMARISLGFSIVEGIEGTSGQKIRQFLMAGSAVMFKNDEFCSAQNQRFIAAYDDEIAAVDFIESLMVHDRVAFSWEIHNWAVEHVSYDIVNKVRVNFLIPSVES